NFRTRRQRECRRAPPKRRSPHYPMLRPVLKRYARVRIKSTVRAQTGSFFPADVRFLDETAEANADGRAEHEYRELKYHLCSSTGASQARLLSNRNATNGSKPGSILVKECTSTSTLRPPGTRVHQRR